MNMADRDKQIQLKVEDIVKGQGAEVVDFKILFPGGKYTLRCVVDRPEGGITLDSCVAINKRVVAYLEESECLGENYAVEINSPGLDRKINQPKDFLKIKGRKVSLWLNEPVEGKEYLEGQVLDVSNDKLSLGYKDKILKVDFSKIKVGKEKIEIKGG